MSEQLNRLGQFLFHIRNGLVPVVIVTLLLLWPPVPMGDWPGDLFLLIGLLLIVLGQTLRMLTIGLDYIIRGGKNRKIYAENLVTGGIFAHSRNPMYVGNLLLAEGCLLTSGNITAIIVGSIFFLGFYRLIVHSEECFLRNTFQDGYQAYCADVPRWIPRLEGLRDTIREYHFDWPGVITKEYGTIFTSLMIPLALISWKLHLSGRLGEYQGILTALAVFFTAAYAVARFLKKTERIKSLRSS